MSFDVSLCKDHLGIRSSGEYSSTLMAQWTSSSACKASKVGNPSKSINMLNISASPQLSRESRVPVVKRFDPGARQPSGLFFSALIAVMFVPYYRIFLVIISGFCPSQRAGTKRNKEDRRKVADSNTAAAAVFSPGV